MIGFRICAFSSVLLMSCASSLAVLGCEDNPRLPLVPDASSNLVLDGGFERYTVIAPSGTTRLTFRSLSPGCYGALLDAVSVRRTPSI